MQIEIIAFGKAKKSEYLPAINELNKRLAKKINIIELDNVKYGSKDEILSKEEKIISPYFLNNNYNIILDSTGKSWSSELFCEKITNAALHYKKIVFFIGSSFGFSENIKKKAILLSLSKMTMPHLLARLILLEQIYRIYAIMQNHPYHK